MKVRELLEYQSFVTKRATPCDMFEGDLEQHYSTSKEEYMDILDMDLVHLIRSYSKSLRIGEGIEKTVVDLMREKLDSILQNTYSARELLDKQE